MKNKTVNQNPLWTRDFTIITLGTVVSMFGNSLSGFVMSLLVYDYTRSPMLYSVYLAAFTLPQIIMPIFSGAILDRFSRKKMIYTLDFISGGLYLIMAAQLSTGWFSFPIFAIYCFIIGSINSIYMVAYDSFYPLLITEGNFQKAYSISSVLETASAVMIPISKFLYDAVGIAPLLAGNAICFIIAATMETQIKAKEDYIEKQKEHRTESSSAKQVLTDIKEGFAYLICEKGLLAVAIYFAFSSLAGGASSTVMLPYFKEAFADGENMYMWVMGASIIGRCFGGMFHYKVKLPIKKKFAIALTVYVVISLIEGSVLYFPFPVMICMMFICGLLGITSYTIRISATQSYVPNEKKGRFNGAFSMLSTVGMFTGELLAGALANVFPMRGVLAAFMGITVISAIVFIGGGKAHVSAIYNRQQ